MAFFFFCTSIFYYILKEHNAILSCIHFDSQLKSILKLQDIFVLSAASFEILIVL